ncbi:MAG TPA: ACP phosphodiesterase [Bacteroidales bacterium]|nr:ACP phosphodiesterase [Bacteroidales bacterium]
MNFLAHFYLSGDSDDIKIGNFIGDYVKGSDYQDYPESIKKGILLHRKIDSYTDTHSVVRKSKLLFALKYRKYAGIIVDILYDHYLSVEWDRYSEVPLHEYIEELYLMLEKNYDRLPPQVQLFVYRFIGDDWLGKYQDLAGIETVLHRMSKRTSLPEETDFALDVIHANYTQLMDHFNQFFVQLVNYVREKFLISFPVK